MFSLRYGWLSEREWLWKSMTCMRCWEWSRILAEARSYIYELTISIQTVTADRRRLEADVASLHFQLEESHRGRREAEERANRLQWEIVRLTHELRSEAYRGRENNEIAGNIHKSLEAEVPEFSVKLVTAHSVGVNMF